MAYDANDKEQVKKAKRKVEVDSALALDVVRNIMQSATGRAWIYNKLEQCHIYGNPFIPGQADTTAFNLGEANQGKILLAEVQAAAPDLYLTMLQEAKNTTS